MFDRLMLMAKGKIIYFNEARLAVDHFSNIGYKCPELSNPSDYFMSIMSIETIESDEVGPGTTLQQVYAKKIQMFNDSYQGSSLKNDPDYIDPSVRAITTSD